MEIDKNTKYDRQLRLWETSGQLRLELSHICLVNATSTGSELLKNLILPGIGKFTIIDDGVVTQERISGNFFLLKQDIGKQLALSLCGKLNELNSDVKGNSMCKSLESVLESEPQTFWSQFSIVAISDYTPAPQLKALKDILWSQRIPLIVVNTVGFYGSLHLITSETTVVETHDPARLYDLRIDKPWPELQELSDSIKLDELNDTAHAHVPYVIIFIKALQEWRNKYGSPPTNYSEKKQFREYVVSMSRDIRTETNFIEASTSTHRALQTTEVPASIQDLFDHPNLQNLTKSTPAFWVLLCALKKFTEVNNGQLPLPGSLPDMASDSESYIKLQTVYKDKALRDQQQFTEHLMQIVKDIGSDQLQFTHETISQFCKNTHLLHVTLGTKKSYSTSMIENMLLGFNSGNNLDEAHLLAIYFGILTLNALIEKSNLPICESNYDELMKLFIDEFAPGVTQLPDDMKLVFKEIAVHNSRSYHNVCSFMGGVASQEALKLTTIQYRPLDDLYIFDGVRSVSEKFKV